MMIDSLLNENGWPIDGQHLDLQPACLVYAVGSRTRNREAD